MNLFNYYPRAMFENRENIKSSFNLFLYRIENVREPLEHLRCALNLFAKSNVVNFK